MSLHRGQRRSRVTGLGRAAAALVLAVACHFTFAGLLVFLSLFQLAMPPRKAATAPRAVTLRPLTSDQWRRNRGEARARAEEPPLASRSKKPAPKVKEPEMPKGQVVDVAPGNKEEPPDARFISETANKVAKETRAKEQTPFYRNAMPKQTSTAAREGSGASEAQESQGLGDDDRPLRGADERKSVFELPTIKERQEIALREAQRGHEGPAVHNRSESAELLGNSDRFRIVPGAGSAEEGSAGKGKAGAAALLPSAAVLDKVSGGAPNDHLEGVETGDGTYLNTKEWKYSGFFNRVKQSVGMHWSPGRELRQRDPTGNIYGGRDRYTMLSVTLSQEGRLKDVYVEKSCGLDFLDLEAIRSFERAQPFPNPPPGLLAQDSAVHFSFGFYLEMGGGPRLRLFRSAN